jgi:sugar O-acyltransferase (sialic acid O-acetyltransferase NeuD family)
MKRSLVILGTTGNAHDILDVVESLNTRQPVWDVAGFLDDAREMGSSHLGLPVLGPLANAFRFGECFFINAIGSDRSYRQRPELVARLELPRERFATLVHPLAYVSSRARLGLGVCVNYGVSVAGGVTVGDHVYLGSGSVIGHDAMIGEHSVLAAAAVVSGFVHIGAACYIGARAVIRGRVRIGAKALVGMGAVVLNDVREATTVVGTPARLLERKPVELAR